MCRAVGVDENQVSLSPARMFVCSLVIFANALAAAESSRQFILLNRRLGPASGRFESIAFEDFEEMKRALPDVQGAGIRIGVGYIFSYFRAPSDEVLVTSLRRVLQLAEETDTPVLIQLDGENWWDERPDLWNWWDRSLPGFSQPIAKTSNGPAGVRTRR
jgi:hypothetical protein